MTLWLDIRNGGAAVRLNGRVLQAATVVFQDFDGLSGWEAARRFCHTMSPAPLLPSEPDTALITGTMRTGKAPTRIF